MDDQIFKEQAESNVFLQLLQRYLPFWPLFVITTILSLSIAFIYLRSQVRVYEATGKVLLKDPNKGSGEAKILDALNIFGDKKIVENEIVVLKSTNLMQEVVKGIHLYATVYNKGRVRIEELYKNSSPVYFITPNYNNIISSEKYFFTVDWAKQQLKIDNKVVHFNDSVVLNNISYCIIPNLAYNKTVTGKNYFVQFNSIENTSVNLIADLKANAMSNQSTVIDVSIETPVPEKGIDILTTLFDVYNFSAIQDKNQTAAKTLSFIDNRLNLVTSQLDSVEKNVQSYKSNNEVYDLSAQSQLFLNNVGDLDKQKSEIDLKLDVLNDINAYVNRKGTDPGTVPSLNLINDPTLASLLQKKYEAEFQLEKNKSIAGEKSDAVILGQEEIGRLRNDIHESLLNIRKNLTASKSNINSNLNANSGILRQIPKKERGLIDISRQQAIKNNIYTFLKERRDSSKFSIHNCRSPGN